MKRCKLNKIINQIQAYCDNYLEICCYGYVTNVRKFSYLSKTYQIQKNALEVNIDFDNYFGLYINLLTSEKLEFSFSKIV